METSSTKSTSNTKTNTAQQSGSTTNSSTSYGSNTSTVGGSHSETNSKSYGASLSDTYGSSHSTSSSVGGSSTSGKTWASGQVNANTQAGFDKYSQEYVQSPAVTEAYNRLQEAISGKPAFQSQYEDKLSSIYDQIMNRDKFNYNFNEDAMYQMHKDQYQQQGRQAMQDTMGQAAALTGGYGSSYAQTAGQQTYQNYLQELNNMIPQLRQQAYDEYRQEGEDLYNKYNITNSAYNNEYGRYRDDVSDWRNDRDFDYGLYSDERNFDYGQFSDNRNYFMNEYWNERNAEQSNASQSNNWSNSTTDTRSQQTTASQNWQYANSVTDASNWSNTSTTGWQNNTSNTTGWQNSMSDSTTNASSNTASSGSGSGSGSTARKGESDKWMNYSAATSNERQGVVNELVKSYESDQKGFNSDLTKLYKNGLTGSQGQQISFSKEDIASLYRSVLAAKNDAGARTYTTNEIMQILGIR